MRKIPRRTKKRKNFKKKRRNPSPGAKPYGRPWSSSPRRTPPGHPRRKKEREQEKEKKKNKNTRPNAEKRPFKRRPSSSAPSYATPLTAQYLACVRSEPTSWPAQLCPPLHSQHLQKPNFAQRRGKNRSSTKSSRRVSPRHPIRP